MRRYLCISFVDKNYFYKWLRAPKIPQYTSLPSIFIQKLNWFAENIIYLCLNLFSFLIGTHTLGSNLFNSKIQYLYLPREMQNQFTYRYENKPLNKIDWQFSWFNNNSWHACNWNFLITLDFDMFSSSIHFWWRIPLIIIVIKMIK